MHSTMSNVWNAEVYDSDRRRLIPCFDEFYGAVTELVVRISPISPKILNLGAGTGILSAAIAHRVPTARLHLLLVGGAWFSQMSIVSTDPSALPSLAVGSRHP